MTGSASAWRTALTDQPDLRLAGVHETDLERIKVLRARGISWSTGDVQDWAASCGALVVCRPGVPALAGRVVYSPEVSAACPMLSGACWSSEIRQLRVPCADALAFCRLLTHLPPVERLFSSCARRAGHATDHRWARVDALEPLFDLPGDDADLRALLAPRVPAVYVRRTLLPYTHSHLHHLKLDLRTPLNREAALDALRRAPRRAWRQVEADFPTRGTCRNTIGTWGERGDRPEVFVWEETVEIVERRLFLTMDVNPDAAPIPDLIDAVRRLARIDLSLAEISRLTDLSLAIGRGA